MDPLHHPKLHSNPTNTIQAQAHPAGPPPAYSSLYSTQSQAISSPDCECECNCNCHASDDDDDDDEDAMPTITIDATTRIHGSHNTIYTPPSANSSTITEAGRVAAALLATWASLSPSPLLAAAAASTGTTTSVGGIGAASAPDSSTGQGAKRRRLNVNLVVRCGVQIVGHANRLAPAPVMVVRGPHGPTPIAPPPTTTPPTPTRMGREIGEAAAAAVQRTAKSVRATHADATPGASAPGPADATPAAAVRSASGAAGTKRKATDDGA
ncbi:hypothetical protein LTR04_004718 [Oleoguttula sp. CCFEE 6159]|nr:hypothetical protein LTR04_004718 [Oleoguttula sp. CCFEE 6159]